MITKSAKQTQALAARLAKTLRGGEVIALQGELGSGKTTFVQGLARALGVRGSVRSPTFVLVQCYNIPRFYFLRPQAEESRPAQCGTGSFATLRKIGRLCHIDAYRLDHKTDPGDLGLHDFMGDPKTVTAIEWPERIKKILPKQTIWIRFGHGKKENERVIEMKPGPDRDRGRRAEER